MHRESVLRTRNLAHSSEMAGGQGGGGMSKCSLTAMAMAFPPCTFVEVCHAPPAHITSQVRLCVMVEIEVDFVEQGAGIAGSGNSYPLVERCSFVRR